MLKKNKGRFGFWGLFVILLRGLAVLQNARWILKTIYPLHYYDLIEKYATEYEVDPYLVLAIIKNESKFNPDAVSKKDAKGLMQIAPITGKWACEKLEIPDYTEDMLFEPELNIRIGVWYLNVLKQEFG